MVEIKGKYNEAKCFTSELEDGAYEQIKAVCDTEAFAKSKIRIMPDVHSGKGCTIGTTMTIKDKVVPNLVGVDIGCGMETLVIRADSEVSKNFDPAKLDKIIRKNIPCGRDIRKFPHALGETVNFDKVRGKYDKHRAWLSVGTLGGGNHFIEADRDDEGNLYIVVHSGSRHAGLEIANYYQEQAWLQLNQNSKKDCEKLIETLKAEGRETEIEELRRKIKEAGMPKSVEEKALGEDVMKSLTPGDQVVKIVYEELVKYRNGKTCMCQILFRQLLR